MYILYIKRKSDVILDVMLSSFGEFYKPIETVNSSFSPDSINEYRNIVSYFTRATASIITTPIKTSSVCAKLIRYAMFVFSPHRMFVLPPLL